MILAILLGLSLADGALASLVLRDALATGRMLYVGRWARRLGDAAATGTLLALSVDALVAILTGTYLSAAVALAIALVLLVDEWLSRRPPRKRRRFPIAGRLAKLVQFAPPRTLPRPV